MKPRSVERLHRIWQRAYRRERVWWQRISRASTDAGYRVANKWFERWFNLRMWLDAAIRAGGVK